MRSIAIRLALVAATFFTLPTPLLASEADKPTETYRYKHLSQERIDVGTTVSLAGLVVERRRNMLALHIIEGTMEALYVMSMSMGEPAPRGYKPKRLKVVMLNAQHDWEIGNFIKVTGEFSELGFDGVPTVTATEVVEDDRKL